MKLRNALERIYTQCRQQLFTAALAVTRCPARAEDAIHEAFGRLLRMPREPRDLRIYVFRAVRNAAIDQVTRSPRLQTISSDSLLECDEDPAEEAGRREFCARVEGVLDALPDADREAVTLHIFAGLTFREIAEISELPEGTVASRYYRALRKLRTELEE